MTCNILVLFTDDSQKLAKELVSRFDNVSINAVSIDTLANFPNFRPVARARINIIFFSPLLLKFLEKRPLDAFHICGQLDASSVLAVFCSGLQERNVLCYHMAPLKSFNSWAKFQISDKESVKNNGRVSFPPGLLSSMYDVIAEGKRDPIEVVVVPQALNRHRNIIYLIFTNIIKKPEEVKVFLNDPDQIDISLELMNPYVMKFSVPESLFQYSHNVKTIVQLEDHVIANPIVHLSQDTSSGFEETQAEAKAFRPRLATKNEVLLEEQIKFLTSFSSSPVEDPSDTFHSHSGHRKVKPQLKKQYSTEDQDLHDLCQRYDLEQLSFFIHRDGPFTKDAGTPNGEQSQNEDTDKDSTLREDTVVGSDCELPDMDSLSNRIDTYLNEETDLFRLRSTRRSLSLPSTLIPIGERDSFDHYMDMTGVQRELKPHELLLRTIQNPVLEKRDSFKKEVIDSLTSGNYVSLILGKEGYHSKEMRNLLKKDLSRSQQELLDIIHNFKDGECTITSLEDEFQRWRKRYCQGRRDEFKKRPSLKKGKTTFAMPWNQKKTKKKELKIKRAESPSESSTSKKISSTTTSSSNSSKTSDASKRYPRYEGCPNLNPNVSNQHSKIPLNLSRSMNWKRLVAAPN